VDNAFSQIIPISWPIKFPRKSTYLCCFSPRRD
jgi:hypothetical protein